MDEYVAEYLKLFSELPSEETREYEKRITQIAMTCISPIQKRTLQTIADSNDSFAYEGFYCLCIVYRRNRDYDLMRKLIVTHQHFKDRISFNHIVVGYQVHSESMYDYDELLESAYDDALNLYNNAGYLQAFCNAFATICENCNEEDRHSIVKRWYKHATKLINRAIFLDPDYAKFYWTKARIIAFNGEYTEAFRLIAQAISLEDSSRPDYFLTILNYQQTKNAIISRQQISQLNKRIDDMESLINKMTSLIKLSADVKEQEEPEAYPGIYEGDQSFVFISYAHKDRSEVYSIIGELQKLGIRIWYDRGIRTGEEWPKEIGEHIVKSALIIVMLSENSINSKYVRREINLADSKSMKIISVVLDDSRLPIGIQLQLGLNQMMYKTACSGHSFIGSIANAINASIGGLQ